MIDWQRIEPNNDTHAANVPGGALVRCTVHYGASIAMSVVFVPGAVVEGGTMCGTLVAASDVARRAPVTPTPATKGGA